MTKLNWRITSWEKILLVIVAVLIGLLSVYQPSQAAHETESIEKDEALLNLFRRNYNKGEVTKALVYLYAYIQRNPTKYATDRSYAYEVDKVYDDLLSMAIDNERMANEINKNLERCNKFQCDDQGNVGSMHSKLFPANMVKVCEGTNLSGKCSILTVSSYTTNQSLGVKNDSISSIEVGEDVNLTLCVHSLQHTRECLTFKGGTKDLNLRNNYVPKGYPIDNNVSTARVAIKPIPGVTTP